MNNQLKRLFLGISPGEEVNSVLTGFIDSNPQLSLRWTPLENRHITTIFIGDFPDKLIPELFLLFRDCFQRHDVFHLDFEGVYPAPKPSRARMIWGRFYQNKHFDSLNHDTFAHLKKFYKDHRLDFQISLHSKNIPHITLARFKSTLPELKSIYFSPLKLEVRSCILFESILRPQGAQYLKLGDFYMKTP